MTQPPAAFDLLALARQLPREAASLVSDMRLVDRPEAGMRLFRLNAPLPRHLHRACDEYLLVVCGRALFTVGEEPPRTLEPGHAVFFERGTWHAFPEILDGPFVVLAIETPPRDPLDVVFERPTGDTFIQTTLQNPND
ncbi:cupin domain-containing protein [uncultured Alsobacter sp.]|uniref:cupin domain-containing protein n=1 Tax=uncultured Alsobacter sp. TaxID=1748258 RepID=UPI0025F13BBF|nr:cupin domain-containing protein [uncultured Alsobacter sp.]